MERFPRDGICYESRTWIFYCFFHPARVCIDDLGELCVSLFILNQMELAPLLFVCLFVAPSLTGSHRLINGFF